MAWLGRISCATRITDSSPLRESPDPFTAAIGLRVRCEPIREITSRTSADPLAEVILLDPGELGRVAVHDGLQRRQGRQLLGLDQLVDLRHHGRVVDDLQVALEDLGVRVAELLRTFWISASRSAEASCTARSNRSTSAGISPGSSSACCSIEPRTESTRWATPTTTPGLTPIPLRMTTRSHGSMAVRHQGSSSLVASVAITGDRSTPPGLVASTGRIPGSSTRPA